MRAGVFRPDECRDIIALHNRIVRTDGHLDEARECSLFWVQHTSDTAWIFERIARYVMQWNEPYGFALSPQQTTGLQLSRYVPGERYDWHMDIGGGPASLRKISMLVELADPAEHGGGFEVFYGDDRDCRIRLRAGDAAIFPSWVMHRAVTPQRGTRWTLAAWILGEEPFR